MPSNATAGPLKKVTDKDFKNLIAISLKMHHYCVSCDFSNRATRFWNQWRKYSKYTESSGGQSLCGEKSHCENTFNSTHRTTTWTGLEFLALFFAFGQSPAFLDWDKVTGEA
jgi:hypothetical protein